MRDATFGCPDLTTFCRLDELGLEVTGRRLEPDRAVLACWPLLVYSARAWLLAPSHRPPRCLTWLRVRSADRTKTAILLPGQVCSSRHSTLGLGAC